MSSKSPPRRRTRFSAFNGVVRGSRQLLEALRERNLTWLVPLVILLIALGVVLTLLAAAGPIAPFLYPLL